MKRVFLVTLLLLSAAASSMGDSSKPLLPFEAAADHTANNHIDELVFARFEKLSIQPAGVCSDAVFVRRVYLDVIGTLPTGKEVWAFLQDETPDKRTILIDQLLERDEYADYWSLKWSDLLRIKAEFPVNLWPNAVQAYHRWLHTSLKENKPYDEFARELLTSSGSNFRVAPVNFYRSMPNQDPKALAQATALLFMGVRMDSMKKKEQVGLTAFFTQIEFKCTAEWKEEIVFHNPGKTATNAPSATPRAAVFPDGKTARIEDGQDPRVVFADWLITDKNPWFAQNMANRCWAWLQGQGIIHKPDDVRRDNPPSNPKLLEYLADELVKSDYDIKHLYRLILNSKTYQLSSIPRSDSKKARANFAYYPVRRLDAEVLIDALCQLSGTQESYESPIPEPFTFIPADQRSILLADGSITSPFLEMFGRPSRDTGLLSERDNNPSSAQRLHLLNSTHIQKKVTQGTRMKALYKSAKTPEKLINRLYATILSRPPTPAERKTLTEYGKTTGSRGTRFAMDLAWALINSKEFLYKH